MVGIREWSRFGKILSACSTRSSLTTIIYYIVTHFITFFRTTKNDNTANGRILCILGNFI